MYIRSLRLNEYRNYNNLDISFSPGINILYGDNAQGKTNILEAIFLSATTKSHRSSKDKEIIKFGSDQAHIRSIWERKSVEYRVDMHLRSMRPKGIALNGQSVKRASELIGLCNVVFFSPEDLAIIKNGPSERRRFIDMELCQIDKAYLNDLNQYSKTVNQRNSLLRDIAAKTGMNMKSDDLLDVLSVWNVQLVNYGIKVINARKKFIDELNEIIDDIHYRLSGEKERLKIEYRPFTKPEDFEENVIRSTQTDLKYKTTNTGPHKDDIIFFINETDVRKFGSQGQQRTAALSLKLAEIEMIRKNKNESPVLLLDDVLSELDGGRQTFLLESIKDIQTIITCTGLDDFVNRRIKIDNVYNVKNGQVLCMENNDI